MIKINPLQSFFRVRVSESMSISPLEPLYLISQQLFDFANAKFWIFNSKLCEYKELNKKYRHMAGAASVSE